MSIIGESYAPGVLVRDVMARYELASSVIYTWRKQAREGKFGGAKAGGSSAGMFAPVAILDPHPVMVGPVTIAPLEETTGSQDIEVPTSSLDVDPSPDQSVCVSPDSMAMVGTTMVVALPDGVRIMVGKDVDEAALGRVLRATMQAGSR